MFNPQNPENLEQFEALDETSRATFVLRLQEQFTDGAAAILSIEGLASEHLGLVVPQAPAGDSDVHRVELTRDAYADWRFLTEVVRRPPYPADLASGLVTLRAGRFPEGCCGPLGTNRYLFRHLSLRWVFRRDLARNVTIIHAVARRGHNPLLKVWRYFSQFKARHLIECGQLNLSRLDILAEGPGGDRYEGTPPAMMAARYAAMLAAYFGDGHQDFLRRYDHARRATFACCWHRAEHEALQMWLLYCMRSPERGIPAVAGGFALQTTERRLQHQLLQLKDLPSRPGVEYFLREIDYVDHATHVRPDAFGEEAFLKAKWFSHEKEMRLGLRHLDCAAAGTVAQTEARLAALPDRELLPVDLDAMTDAIVLNPNTSATDRDELRRLIAEHRPALSSRVKVSEIETPPVPIVARERPIFS